MKLARNTARSTSAPHSANPPIVFGAVIASRTQGTADEISAARVASPVTSHATRLDGSSDCRLHPIGTNVPGKVHTVGRCDPFGRAGERTNPGGHEGTCPSP